MPHLPARAACAAACALALAHPALAVNGAQPGGHGAANAAMGGAGIALPLDAEAAANNPAGVALLPSSTTLGLQAFHGDSSAEYVLPGNRLRNRDTTVGPEGGVTWRASGAWTIALGADVAGAGSNYRHAALPVAGAPEAKLSLAVIELIPTVAWRPRDDIAVGVALNVAHEAFEAQGIIVAAPVPGGLLPLPVHGKQHADGVGLRAGVLWSPTADIAVGASLKSRTHMSRLAGYREDVLAASDGRMDVPSEYGIGLAWRCLPSVTLAADVLRIDWGELGMMKDPQGFRWRDQPVERIGAAWAWRDDLTLRAGYSHNRRQIASDRAVQNLLVPSIHDHTFTAGLTWQATPANAASLGYEFDPQTTLHGTGASAGTSLTSKAGMLMVSWQHVL
jgi:long-chain fatty acid transport protein